MSSRPFNIGCVALVLSLPLAACHRAETDPRTRPPLVRVMTPHRDSGTSREFTGVVAARVQSDLGFRVAGKVIERLVDAGQAVERGQPLMRIDHTDLALATRPAETVHAARARARKPRPTSGDFAIWLARGQFRPRHTIRRRPQPTQPVPSLRRRKRRLESRETRPTIAFCWRTPTARLCKHWQSRARSSVPARSSCGWPMPGRAKRRSTSGNPAAGNRIQRAGAAPMAASKLGAPRCASCRMPPIR